MLGCKCPLARNRGAKRRRAAPDRPHGRARLQRWSARTALDAVAPLSADRIRCSAHPRSGARLERRYRAERNGAIRGKFASHFGEGSGVKVFISWSGKRSRSVASALKEWIPTVLEDVEPWVSDKDISAGERWSQSVAGELEAANFGIICITPENVSNDWILFEAGALSKSMQDARVIPLLFELDFSDISGPLAQFQAKKLDVEGVREVITAINKCALKPTADDVVSRRFGPLWGSFEDSLKKIPAKEPAEKTRRSQPQILEDLVSTVRSLEVRLRDSDTSRFQRRRRLSPGMFMELIHSDEGMVGGVSLLMLAGILREEAPWASEILIDANRDLEDSSKSRRLLGQKKLKYLAQMLERGHPMMRDISESKESYYLLRELPQFLEFRSEILLHSERDQKPPKET
jgi:hypothetical protein